MRRLLFAALASFAPVAGGCSSVGSSAVRTDGLPPRANVGPVRVYALGAPPSTRVVGFVEVHAVQDEANIQTLMPVFIRRVAEVGGSGAVVDHVLTGYEWRTEMRYESFAYPCGYRATCYSSQLVPYTYEVRYLTIQGRAIVPFSTNAAPTPSTSATSASPAPPPSAAPSGSAKPGGWF